jgi:hypothetical protein
LYFTRGTGGFSLEHTQSLQALPEYRALEINRHPIADRDVEARGLSRYRDSHLSHSARDLDVAPMYAEHARRRPIAVDIELRLEERSPTKAF